MLAAPVARVYAEALFGIARDAGSVDETGAELEEFLALLRREPEIELFLTSPVLEKAEKVHALAEALEGRMSGTTADFLCLLVEKGRLGALGKIAEAYRALADELQGRVRVSVRSAAPIPEGLRKEMKEVLRSGLRKSVVLEEAVEPALLGGAVVTIGDTVYDGSIRSRLARFRRQMMRSRGYEDQG
jgi:F-type H+-transporting ATPase subunit delta